MTKKHKETSKGRKGKDRTQPGLVSASSADRENNGHGEATVAKLFTPTGPRIISMDDRVTKAETVLILKGVESQWTYSSFDNLADCLKKADPESKIFDKMKLKSAKASYVISHGLGPYFKSQIVSAVKAAPGYTLGTDSATFRHMGLSKHVDIVLQYWDEKDGQVKYDFFDYHSVGHEPADLQVKNVRASVEDSGLSLADMLGLSRDNPTVMQAMARKLREVAEACGNMGVIDTPCYLHPVHTSFQKAVKGLDADIEVFLVNLHGFFKLSTARREDRNVVQGNLAFNLGDEFEEVMDRFYLRFVSTRWLEMEGVVARVLELWASTKEYFLVFLPGSKVQCNKAATKTQR